MVTLFLGLPFPPTTTVVCFRWVWSVVVLYLTWYSTICIVLITAAVVATNFWVNSLSQLLKPFFTVYLVLSRFSVGGVLYITCISSPLAWWHQHDVTSIAKWCGQASFWLLAIWLLLLLNRCLWSGKQISLNTCWQSDDPMSLNSHWQFGDILSLSSNDRICSFNWIGGSKHCFLTSFSNFITTFFFFYFWQFATWGRLNVHCHRSWYSNWIFLFPCVRKVPSIDSTCFLHT